MIWVVLWNPHYTDEFIYNILLFNQFDLRLVMPLIRGGSEGNII